MPGTRAISLISVVAVVAVVSTSVAVARYGTAARPLAANAGPVVLELFTSEGCSSCPPADRLLAEIDRDPRFAGRVIPLAFHVDYWDRLGWRDRFSSSEWTKRQDRHAAVIGTHLYTPQLVVDGRFDLIGSDPALVYGAIARAGETPKPVEAHISASRISESTVEIAGSVAPRAGTVAASGLALTAVLVEGGLETRVAAGENAHRTLHHDFVVRALRRMDAFEWKGSGPGDVRVRLEIPADAAAGALAVVVLIEDPASLAVVGAARASVPPRGETHAELPRR